MKLDYATEKGPYLKVLSLIICLVHLDGSFVKKLLKRVIPGLWDSAKDLPGALAILKLLD